MDKVRDFIKNSRLMQGVLIFLIGATVGAIFYPTKHIEETLTKKHEAEIKSIKEQHSIELSKSQESLTKAENSLKEHHKQSELTISKLTTEIKTLNSKQKTAYYKIVKPDGTIEIKKFTESDVDESTKVVSQIQEEFKQKIDSIEKKWSILHKERVVQIQKEFAAKEEEYKKEIDELKQTKVVDINKRSFGIEAGILLNKNYYGHVTYDFLGPLFLGLHSEIGSNPTNGIGIGLRF